MNDFTIAPSALAYLFGDMLEETFAGRARLSFNETLPCREAKVKKKDLANVMLVSAFVDLVKEDCLRLELSTKGMIIKSKFVLATRSARPASRFDALEGQILANVSGKAKDDGVSSIVARVLRKDSADPWGEVIREAQKYLLGQGYLVESERQGIAKLLGKELTPQCAKILALQGEAGQVKAMLSDFRAGQPQLYEQLWKDVSGGITSRQETPEADFD